MFVLHTRIARKRLAQELGFASGIRARFGAVLTGEQRSRRTGVPRH